MKLLLINSSEKNAFAAMVSDTDTEVHYASEFTSVSDSLHKNPDKLINCLEKLSVSRSLKKADAIAVTTGPGSFTGIRVGLSLAKGIAFASEKKIIPIDNFTLTLNRLEKISDDTSYCVIIEAKQPEYYYSLYQNGDFTESGTDNFENIQKKLKKDTVVVGDFGDESLLKHYYFKYLNVKNHKSELESMNFLAKELFKNGNLFEASQAEPLYLKEFNFMKK